MNKLRGAGLLIAVATVLALLASTPAFAGEGEITGFIGGLIGGDLNALQRGEIVSSFENGVMYGVRGGWYGYPLAVEGSFAYSPSGLSAVVEDDVFSVDTQVTYLDANVLLIILPYSVSPFVTGGAGLQTFDFSGDIDAVGLTNVELVTVNKFGFNFGGGIKANIKRLTLRLDIRDHLTTFTQDDFGLIGEIAEIAGITFDETVHNVEVSFGVGIRF
jgi:hypothetical protein